jgi:ribosomal protein L24E
LVSATTTNQVHKTLDVLAWGYAAQSASVYNDLQMTLYRENTNNGWNVNILATNRNDGLIFGTNLLFEAPLTGYVRQCSFSITNMTPQTGYLYVRSRDPVIFSRIRLEYSQLYEYQKPPGVRFLFEEYVNPYGERTFEYDERFNQFWQEKPKWIEEAKAALREGRYPEKIDIDALIKAKQEAEEKAGEKP